MKRPAVKARLIHRINRRQKIPYFFMATHLLALTSKRKADIIIATIIHDFFLPDKCGVRG
jgi:hypothetical protein